MLLTVIRTNIFAYGAGYVRKMREYNPWCGPRDDGCRGDLTISREIKGFMDDVSSRCGGWFCVGGALVLLYFGFVFFWVARWNTRSKLKILTHSVSSCKLIVSSSGRARSAIALYEANIQSTSLIYVAPTSRNCIGSGNKWEASTIYFTFDIRLHICLTVGQMIIVSTSLENALLYLLSRSNFRVPGVCCRRI